MAPCTGFASATLLLALIATGDAVAQDSNRQAEIDARCRNYLSVSLPAEGTAAPAPAGMPTCHSLWLYYGFGGEKQDVAAARQCAWKERAFFLMGGRVQGSPADEGLETLANIYANGVGVTRDVRLALRFACEDAKLLTHTTMHIDDLEGLLNKPAPSSKADYFNMCEGESNTPEINVCASWQEVLADDQRREKFASLESKWTEPQKAAFGRLLKAEDQYAEAHGHGEINLAGTMRVIFEMDAKSAVGDDFAAALRSFEDGHLPARTEAESSEADAALNREYPAIMDAARAHEDEYGAVEPDGVRDAERAWLKYRDAFVSFAAVRYPLVHASAWLELLTRDRILILKDTACEIDEDAANCPGKGDARVVQPLP